MTARETLPGGGKPWFVRNRKVRPFGATRWQIVPCSREGWLVIAAFVLVNLLSVLLLIPEPTPARIAAFVAVIATASVLLVVISLRMSPPEWRDK